MNDREPFRLTDPRQGEIHAGLGLVGVAAQEFFLDACRMLAGEPLLTTRAHLVGHCLREIESATRQVLRSFSSAQPISMGKERTRGKKAEHAEQVQEIIDLLGIDPSGPIAHKWLQIADPDSDEGLHKRAHRHNLGPSRPMDEDFLKAWEAMQAILLEIVQRMRGKYADVYARLDRLAAASDDHEKAVGELWDKFPHNPTALNYFFNRINDPAWIAPLREKGYFTRVYDPELTARGSQAVPWLQSRYLARMADMAPEHVHAILMELPDTGNYWVHADLADAAVKLPDSLAAEWARKEAVWIRSRDQIGWLLPRAYKALATKLADSKELDACHEFSQALLGPLPGGEAHGPKALFRVESHDYEDFLKEVAPRLSAANGAKTVGLLTSLLEEAIGALRGSSALYMGDSNHWRRAVEEHPENFRTEPLAPLVAALRVAVEHVATRNADGANAVLALLRGNPLGIIRRIALHSLIDSSPALGETMRAWLTDRELFNDQECQREFWRLAKARFGDLSAKERQVVLDLVQEGPMRPPDLKGEAAVAWEEMMDRLHLRRLTILKRHLSESDLHDYQRLVEKHGEYIEPEPLPRTFTGTMESPLSAEEIAGMTNEELAGFLTSWKPTGQFLAPSPTGLGFVLTEGAKRDPLRFAKLSPSLHDVEPTYVHSILDGLKTAVGTGAEIAWPAVLTLCLRVAVKEPGVAPDWDPYGEQERSWGTAHRSVLRLIDQGFNEGRAQIPRECASQVRSILEALAAIPAEHPADGYPDFDPHSFVHETTRSIALGRVIRYLWWNSDDKRREYSDRDLVRRSPAVAALLERLLDPGQDPSPGTRAVFGQLCALLLWADREWLAAHVELIFPSDPALERLRRAAWGGFIVNTPPHALFFRELRSQYGLAVDRPGKGNERGFEELDPDNRLAEHLVLLHSWGVLDLKHDGLIDRFFRSAPLKARIRALSFHGQALSRADNVPSDIGARIQQFVDWRLEAAAHDPQIRQEFSWCAWIFTSGKLEPEWTIDRLERALRVNPEMDPDHMVADYLCTVVDTHPAKAVECIDAMAHGTTEGWRVHSWHKQAIQVLRAARRSGDELAREHAERLANELVSRGYLEFREVLAEVAS